MQARLTQLAATRAALLIAAAAVSLAACGSAQSTASASTSHPPTNTPVPSPTQRPPSVVFGWPDAPDPVVTRTMTGIEQQYINPGAVIDHDGRLHMFANVFTAWPGHVDVPYLVSDDGAAWALATPEPVFSSDDTPSNHQGADVSTGFVTDDGTWVLIIESVSSIAPWDLYRATAARPEGPWTFDPVPILSAGAEGQWDAGGLHWPSVVRTADGYALYYAGFDSPRGSGAIGLATSVDGTTWTKHDGPVMVGEEGWERGRLDRPRVAVTPDGFAMVYAGAELTDRGLAWSDDGITWRRDGDLPAIEQAHYPVNGRAWDAALIFRDGQLTYYLEIGGTGGVGTSVYRATAPLP